MRAKQSSIRRAKKVICEALENRRLMSLTIEVRDAGGGTSTTVSTVGQVLNLQVLAVITDPLHEPSEDGLSAVDGNFISTAVYGHAVDGNLAAANIRPFTSFGSSPGTQQDLNGDGNLDVGINEAIMQASTGQLYQTSQGQFSATALPAQLGTSGTGTISGNSLIFEIATLTYTVTNLSKGGETSINFSPRVSFAPDAAGWLEDFDTAPMGGEKDNTSGTYQAGTPYIVSDPALVVAPVANNFNATATINTPTDINELSVDDVIVPLNDASVTPTVGVSHGTLALQTNGSFLYTPNNGYLGTDSFTYTVADTDGRVSNPATVTITVVPAPPPVATADSATTLLNQPATIDVLAVDTVTAPATLVAGSVTIITNAGHGTAVAQTNGSILYTPASGFTGTDTFSYAVTDTNAETSNPGTVTVTVEEPVAPMVPTNTPESTTAGAALTINLTTLATVGTSPLSLTSIVIVTPPTEGTAAPQPNGSILYSPTPGFTGTDSFTYTIADTTGLASNTGTISMTITHGVPPVAGTVTANVLANQANPIDVLASAPAGEAPLVPGSVTVVTQPNNGHATVNTATGAIVYTPVAGFIGADSFTYTVGNTNLDTSAPALVRVEVGSSISNAKGAAHTLSFNDAAGGVEILSINIGTAEIFFTGTGSVTTTGTKSTVTGTSLNLEQITLTGTTKASTLAVKGSVKTPATVGAITDTAPLGGINAPSLSIVEQNSDGIVSNNQSINLASAGTLVFGSVSGAVIQIGAGAPGKVAITAGTVSTTTLSSAVPITALKATAWLADQGDSITAPSIGTLTIASEFQPDLNLSGTGKFPAISSAKIGGALAGNWSVSGAINTVTANSVGDGWTGSLGGAAVKSFTIKSGGLASNISAGAIGSLSIAGSLTGNITASSIKSLHITDDLTGSNIDISGALGTIQLTGQTAQFTDSTIAANAIASASLGTIVTDNGGSAFGITTKSIGSFAGKFAGSAVHLSRHLLQNEIVLQSYLDQQGVLFGDFGISL